VSACVGNETREGLDQLSAWTGQTREESSTNLGVNTVHRRVSVELRLLDTVSVSLGVLVVVGVVLRLEGGRGVGSKVRSQRSGSLDVRGRGIGEVLGGSSRELVVEGAGGMKKDRFGL
jgi:hypothetical protein